MESFKYHPFSVKEIIPLLNSLTKHEKQVKCRTGTQNASTCCLHIFLGQHYLLYAGWKERKQARKTRHTEPKVTQTHITMPIAINSMYRCDSSSWKWDATVTAMMMMIMTESASKTVSTENEKNESWWSCSRDGTHHFIVSFCFYFLFFHTHGPDGTSRIHWVSYIQIAAKYGINYMTVILPSTASSLQRTSSHTPWEENDIMEHAIHTIPSLT